MELVTRIAVCGDRSRAEAYDGDAQRVVAEDAPYISLWYKTNIAVSRTNIEGVKLTPSADFAACAGETLTAMGRHPVKGLSHPVEVFAPSDLL